MCTACVRTTCHGEREMNCQDTGRQCSAVEGGRERDCGLVGMTGSLHTGAIQFGAGHWPSRQQMCPTYSCPTRAPTQPMLRWIDSGRGRRDGRDGDERAAVDVDEGAAIANPNQCAGAQHGGQAPVVDGVSIISGRLLICTESKDSESEAALASRRL